jgi:dolichyl-phosphate-mannose-protein mannosyltransferase
VSAGEVINRINNNRPFTVKWFRWIFYTGVSLGAVLSVKWVGLFVIALVGLHTIQELWDMFGDLNMDPKVYMKHWLFRIIALIIVPILVYMWSFKIHFAILNMSGDGDANMGSIFQANLQGNDMSKYPLGILEKLRF